MKKWKLFTGVALVFVLGVVAGSLGTGFYHKYLFARHKGDPSARKAFILKRFCQKLDLTENQKNEFTGIIDQLEGKREQYFRKSRLELGKIMDQGFSQMREVLSPKQQKKFDELKKRHERHRKPRTGFGPPRPK